MAKMLENLYDGKIYPAEQMKYTDTKHKTVWVELKNIEKTFLDTLSHSQKEEFEKVLNINSELVTIEMKQAFSEGFSLATKIMIEVFEEGKHL